jgi:CHAT domain-containing protein/Tfp pilus assembly protein PilF
MNWKPTKLLCILMFTFFLVNGRLLSAAPSYQSNDPAALVAEGDALLLENDFEGAQAAYEAAIAIDSTCAAAYAHRCYLRTFQHRYDEAITDCQQAITLASDDPEGYMYLTRAYDWNGEFAAAIEAGEQAIALAPDNGLAHSFLGEAYLDAGKEKAGRIAIRRAVELAPNEPEVHRNLAYLHGTVGDFEAQLAEAEVATSLAPNFTHYHISVAEAHTNIAAEFEKEGRYEEALGNYQQALSIARKAGDRIAEGGALNFIGEVYVQQGRYEEALEVYQQVLAIARELGARDTEARLLIDIGEICIGQGRYAEALEFHQQALVISQDTGNRMREGVALQDIGVVHQFQGRYPEALESLARALAIHREVGNRAAEMRTLGAIAMVYHLQGRYTEALETYEQALTILPEVEDRPAEGIYHNNIGAIYADQGRYAKALESYFQALSVRQSVGDRAGEGEALNNIGSVYAYQGRYSEALDNLQQALTILREVGDLAGTGRILSNIGVVYEKQGRYAEALDSHQQALALTREVGAQQAEGTTINNIGSLYHQQGRYAQALESYEQALVIRREIKDVVGEAATLNNIGEVHRAQGRYSEALESLERALAILRETGNRSFEGSVLSNIGLVYQEQERYTEALEYYLQAMDVFEAVRAATGSEQGRASYIAQYADLYDGAIGLLNQQGDDEEAFYTSERGRARAFLDSITTGHIELGDNATNDLLAKEQEAYTRRQAAQDALERARDLDPPDPDLVIDLETELAEAEADYQATQVALGARGWQVADLALDRGTEKTILDLSRVQTLLDEQTTLISYYVLEVQTIAFLITHDSFQTFVLDVSREELTTEIEMLRDFPNLEVAYPGSAVTLFGWLVEPLKEHLSTSHLTIIPHNVLHYLPFAALTDGQRYLIDDYILTTLPSASALPFIQDNTGRALAVPLILGNPTSGDYDATASLATERDGLGSLPHAEKEAKVIAALYGVGPLLGKDATEGAVRERAGEAGILHLAAHGYYNPVAPLSSLIALAPDDTNDGWLTVAEVYGLDLSNTDLVVLSACQTNLGELSEGDELVGLTRAFIFAGTPSVVASLWSVEDESTALLMERFYTHLRDGMGKAEALRQAQLEVREQYPNPHYWAGFVLSGDGGGPGAGRFSPESVWTLGFLTPLLVSVGLTLAGTVGMLGYHWRRQRQQTLIEKTLQAQRQVLRDAYRRLRSEPESLGRAHALRHIIRELQEIERQLGERG